MTTIIRSTFLTALALLFAVSQLGLAAESHHKFNAPGERSTELPQNTSGMHHLHVKAPSSGGVQSKAITFYQHTGIHARASWDACSERKGVLDLLTAPNHWIHWTEATGTGLCESLLTDDGTKKLASCSSGIPD